jgi:hypothetical protein
MLAGFRFQSIKHCDRILHQPREVFLPSELPDKSRRMPGAAMGELGLFDQQHIPAPIPSQMISQRRADGPSANNQYTDFSIPVHDFTR